MAEVRKKIAEIYSTRNPLSKKYDFGHLLVIGGSNLYSGSPAFNALAALRCGADLVTIASPQRAADIVASFSPDLITYPLKGKSLSRKHIREIESLNRKFNACVIGGGLGRERETFSAVRDFLKRTKLPCVIDADAIHAVASRLEILKGRPFLLTPNIHEFSVLGGEKVRENPVAAKEQVRTLAGKLKTTILLKGSTDIISDGIKVEVNHTGSPFMTKGGCGDLLAGVCGAILARKVSCFDAAICAAYINGSAGELAGRKFGESMLASDVLQEYWRVVNT